MLKYTLTVPVCVLFLLASILTLPAGSQAAAAHSGSATYFSSGQAVYDPQNTVKSQQQAIQDFMVEGLTQAIGSFLNPAQMGSQFAEIQKKVLAKPAKYIDSYQVFSEEQTDGMFRVVGQVTVSMEALKKDLVNSGILAAQQESQELSASSTEIGAPAAAAESENAQAKEVARSAEGSNQSQTSTSQPPVVEQGGGRPPSRGIVATKREVLWAVTEKWDQEWVLPTDGSDIRSLFVQSIGREMDDFDFSIHLPQPGSVRMDLSGNIPPSQAISLAEGIGIQDVVVGKVAYTQDRNSRQVFLDASLRVIRIAQGKSEFELHKAQSMEDLTNQEGALELARRIAPQLSSVLGGPQVAGAQEGGAGSTAGPEASSARAGSVGTLLIYLPSSQYSYWMELEKVLREQFRNMRTDRLEIGTTQSFVKLEGVNGEYILKMSGTQLPSGAVVQIDSYSTETQTMKLSFTPPAKVQAETR